ncbi:MAG TPA: FAD-dependent thymidylate synthase [Candidatus Binatia bacterium]|nr:FAD-dependent thymidylate synthase [Candidatus Binatia bacterium]
METRRPTTPAAEEILGRYFPVLDHGFVALVDYMGSDEDVERAARVSYGYGTRRTSETRGLIRYLRRHHHTTPFEMVELKFHCAMPIFVARQWIRHRTASVNEYSGRYSLLPLLFYRPDPGLIQMQSASNRQGRDGAPPGAVVEEALARWDALRQESAAQYEWLVGHDVARELARIDLPLSVYTQWYWKIDLHNLLHFLTLRVDPHAQVEIRAYARVMAGMLARVAPLSFEAWVDYELAGVRLSRVELALLRRLVHVGDDQTLRPRDGARPVGQEDMLGAGLSAREIAELVAKLERPPAPADFALDPAAALSAEEFAAHMAAAVPRVDRR